MSEKKKELLIRLQNEWYQKLKDEGFKDIESVNASSQFHSLKKYHARLFGSIDPEYFENKRAHYEMASWFLETFKFENETQRLVWSLYCEGMSWRKIAKRIDATPYYVERVILALRQIMEKDRDGEK